MCKLTNEELNDSIIFVCEARIKPHQQRSQDARSVRRRHRVPRSKKYKPHPNQKRKITPNTIILSRVSYFIFVDCRFFCHSFSEVVYSLLREQTVKSFLFKMAVSCQCVRNAVFAHQDKIDCITERIGFIHAL